MPKKQVLEKIVEAPALVLDTTIQGAEKLIKTVEDQTSVRRTREFWHLLGPGLTTGAADDDPSGIATYSQTGTRYGNQLLWLATLTFPLMAVVQEMCARIGIVTGQGLAANIRRHFPRPILMLCTFLLFAANTLNIGADLGAMAKSAQLLSPKTDFTTLLLLFALVSLGLQIFISYATYAKFLKYLALILLAYILTAFVIPNFDWQAVTLAGLVPHLSLGKDQIILICAILGTTISPYLFFWQTGQEVEDEILAGRATIEERQASTTPKQIREMRIDVWAGMFLSNLVMFFIIAVAAATLFSHGVTTITTAADAAAALEPLAGNYAFLLFALGIIGTGLLAIPVLAGSSAYAFAESFGWPGGLYRQLHQARAFYGIIIIGTGLGFAFNFLGFDPIKILIYSAVANGLIAPLILALIVSLSSNPKVMGPWTNHPFTRWLGWLITFLMIGAGLATIIALVV